jgi:hypothetical protein
MNPFRIVAALCLVGVVFGSILVLNAQSVRARPAHLAGTWTLSAESNDPSPLGRQITIAQDATSITIMAGDDVITHRPDGEASEYTTGAAGSRVTHRSEARWVSSALVISIQSTSGTGQWGSVLVFSIDHDGQLRVVEVAELVMPGPHMGTRLLTYVRAG